MAGLPVLIVGAGISGLLLAQELEKNNIAYRLFERDADFSTRGVGWGLTLNWSLPVLQSILPTELFHRLPSCYVDPVAVHNGEASTFPFCDLSSGIVKYSVPAAPESKVRRVTRQKFRQLLSVGLSIEWGKTLKTVEQHDDCVNIEFEDGTSAKGVLLVACDGVKSRVRRLLNPTTHGTFSIPIRLLGFKMHLEPAAFEPVRRLDPFFLQGSSTNNVFMYISVLDAPSTQSKTSKYVCQVCVSWPFRSGFWGRKDPQEFPSTHNEKYLWIQEVAATWADPFRSFLHQMPEDTEIKELEVHDFQPPKTFRTHERTVLMGDALHAMAMYRGEGANHAIQDVGDFAQSVTSPLQNGDWANTRNGLDTYEDTVVRRARSGVLASRQACLDAHDWPRIVPTSPLLTKREPFVAGFDEDGAERGERAVK